MPIISGTRPMPPISSTLPKVKRGMPAGLLRPTLAISRPRKSETKPLSGCSDVRKTAQVSPISTSQKYSNELNFSANSASVGADDHQHGRSEEAADRREDEARPQRELGLALVGHRVGFVGVGGRRRRPGHAQQAAGDVAGEDRHRRRGDDRRDGRDRRHEERDGHEERRRHRRGEAGHRADEEAEQRRAPASRRCCTGRAPSRRPAPRRRSS